MNKSYDYNGTIVSTSKPVRELRTVKKTLLIDSADRDTVKYYTNGDVVYSLPRVYENVLSIRLKSATFPRLFAETSPGALTHPYSASTNNSSGYVAGSDVVVSASESAVPHYFLIEMEGLNKSDETTVNAQRSTFSDNFYARVVNSLSQNAESGYFINYNDSTEEENKAIYSPPIGKLDRLHVVTRLHSQQDKSGFIYWTSTGAAANGTLEKAAGSNYSLVIELTMLDNSFDNFSSFETRLSTRADTSNSTGHFGYGC
jgi:hypothetical protein